MMAMMEKYQKNLEDLVDERTTLLVDEKKKTEALLLRMLPRYINPLPDTPILGSSNLAANKDMMAKIGINGDTNVCLSREHSGKMRNCSLRAISSFSTMFSDAVCCYCVKTSIYGVKGQQKS